MFDFLKRSNADIKNPTLQIDDESILKKLQEKEGYTSNEAQNILKEIKAIQPELFCLIEAWYAGKFVNYRFKGITIASLMKKQHCSYLGAITWMNFSIKNPDVVKDLKTLEFKQR